ncbi:hypothetical protein GCM10023153_24080 [Ornithinibacter aureus]|uniref:Transposase n=1 Tax=Ornithinibacter aureus TaxID=622664 RepID=A0ABP8K0E5_9MICO
MPVATATHGHSEVRHATLSSPKITVPQRDSPTADPAAHPVWGDTATLDVATDRALRQDLSHASATPAREAVCPAADAGYDGSRGLVSGLSYRGRRPPGKG